MAKNTRSKIFIAAVELFSIKRVESVSIAEICRKATVSNGVYYRYFNNKEELFRAIIDEFLIYFENALNEINGINVEEKLYSFINTIIKIAEEKHHEIAIFREGQYRLYGYEDTLRGLYIRSAEYVFERKISEVEYLYIVSGLRFCSIRALHNNINIKPEDIRDFILYGVFPESSSGRDNFVIPLSFDSPPESSIKSSYEKLIHCGIFLFGKSGFYNTTVADISGQCGLAVGTFYSHFESKEQFLNTIVLYIGEKTRHYLSKMVCTHGNRLEQEIFGIWYFLNYFDKRLEYYSIVREAEFVGKDVVGEYYDAFEHGYMKNLFSVPEAKKISAANFLIGLSHYTGIEILHRRRIKDIPLFMNNLALLLKKGIIH
jgi:AcrR family transcriptional regulator